MTMKLPDTMILLTAVILFVLVLPLDAQRTFMRSCDCEYTVDGKCAYTLLLPTSFVNPAGAPSCEKEEEDSVSGVTEKLEWLEQRTRNLTDWNTEQTRLFTQLQSTLIYLKDEVAVLRSDSQADKSGDSSWNTTKWQSKIEENSQGIADLKETLLQTQNAILGADTAIIEVENDVADLREDFRDLHDRFNRSQVNQAESTTLISRLLKDVADLKKREAMCRQRGLIVTGPIKNITDDMITASSVYNNEHGPPRSRIFNEELPGAWCPSESNDPEEPDEPNEDEEWLEYDLGSSQAIFGVVTRGRADHAQWVTEYKLAYANEEIENAEGVMEKQWMSYNDALGDPQMFEGNVDQPTAKINMLWQPLTARWVRIIATAANERNKCMRADLIGCLDS